MERYPEFQLGVISRARAGLLYALFNGLEKVLKKGGPITDPDESRHQHTEDYFWNESHYFNFTDPKKKLGGFTRIGMMPNKKTATAFFSLWLEDGSILMFEQDDPVEVSLEVPRVGELSYEMKRPQWEWRLRYQGRMLSYQDTRIFNELLEKGEKSPHSREVSLDLVFSGWSPCFNSKELFTLRCFAERLVKNKSRLMDLRAISKYASEHYEQVGTCTGELEIDGKKITVEGSGHRDHSWGTRQYEAMTKWTWLTGQFDGNVAFNLARVVMYSLDIMSGFICREGKNYPLRRAHLETEFEADGLTQKHILCRLEDVSGWEMEIVGTPLNIAPFLLEEEGNRFAAKEGFAEYRWNDRVGYGIAEYFHKLKT